MVQLQYEGLNLEYLLGFAAVLIAQKPVSILFTVLPSYLI